MLPIGNTDKVDRMKGARLTTSAARRSGAGEGTADPPSSGREPARRFGKLVREHREALGMKQEEVALATGVGRRFVIELEAGKPNCQLGKALLVAEAVGLRPFDVLTQNNADNALLPDLPEATADLPEDVP